MRFKATIGFVVTAGSLFGIANADINQGNYGSWNGSDYIGSLGAVSPTNAYGEIFTAPTGATVLTSFTNTLFGYGDNSFALSFCVAAWNGSMATGPVLFQQDGVATPVSGFQTYNFNTGNIAVTAGQQYVAFFTNLGAGNTDASAYIGEAFNFGATTSGQYSQWDNGTTGSTTIAGLFANPWDGFGPSTGDFVYNAQFNGTSTPAPAAILPFAVGLFARRRRKN